MIRSRLTAHMGDAELGAYHAEVEAMRNSICARKSFRAKIGDLTKDIADVFARKMRVCEATARIADTRDSRDAHAIISDWLDSERDALVRARKKWERLLERRKEGDGSFEERMRIAKAVPIETLFSPEKAMVTQTRIHCLCPFHVERSASFVVFRDTNRFHCFGCGLNGDAMDFHRKASGTSLMETLDELSPIKK